MQDKDFETLALEDVAYSNQHTLTVLLELLIDKGVITEQEFKDKIDEMVKKSEPLEELE